MRGKEGDRPIDASTDLPCRINERAMYHSNRPWTQWTQYYVPDGKTRRENPRVFVPILRPVVDGAVPGSLVTCASMHEYVTASILTSCDAKLCSFCRESPHGPSFQDELWSLSIRCSQSQAQVHRNVQLLR